MSTIPNDYIVRHTNTKSNCLTGDLFVKQLSSRTIKTLNNAELKIQMNHFSDKRFSVSLQFYRAMTPMDIFL